MSHPADRLVDLFLEAVRQEYGTDLRSAALYGSVARGTAGPDSGIGILPVADDWPRSRLRRWERFAAVEEALRRTEGVGGPVERFSTLLLSPEEVERGGLLFLDLTEDARILYDRDDFLRRFLDGFRERLRALGARRLPWKGGRYWDLKPDYRPGEVFGL